NTIIHSATFSPDGARIATAFLGQIDVWDVASGREVAELKARGGVPQVQFSPNGTLLSAGSGSGTSQQWDAASGAELAVVRPARGCQMASSVETEASCWRQRAKTQRTF